MKAKKKVLEKLLNANFQAQGQETICLMLSYEGPEIKPEECRKELESYLKRLRGLFGKKSN